MRTGWCPLSTSMLVRRSVSNIIYQASATWHQRDRPGTKGTDHHVPRCVMVHAQIHRRVNKTWAASTTAWNCSFLLRIRSCSHMFAGCRCQLFRCYFPWTHAVSRDSVIGTPGHSSHSSFIESLECTWKAALLEEQGAESASMLEWANHPMNWLSK